MEELRKEYPVLSGYTYLNTASSGLISKSLVKWRSEHDNEFLNQGSLFRDDHKRHIDNIRNTVSRFFEARTNEIALIPNFSFGFNTLLDGFSRKLKVLLLTKDYPSINWAVENRDFAVCYATIDENLELNIEEAVAKYRPDVFAFSVVQYLNGIKIDFDFLRKLKAYHPNLLLVADGTQYLGTEPFSFIDSPIDIIGASCYKWLLAGYGNGLLLIKEDIHDRIKPSTLGFNSSDATYSKRNEIPLMKLFEPGHQDTLNYGSLEYSINSLISLDMNMVSMQVASISEAAKERFMELALLEDEIVNRRNHSSIFNIKGDSMLFQKLKDNRIICSQRGNGIRVSFHFYNTLDDLDHLISVLE